jgi:hypothetical protein
MCIRIERHEASGGGWVVDQIDEIKPQFVKAAHSMKYCLGIRWLL